MANPSGRRRWLVLVTGMLLGLAADGAAGGGAVAEKTSMVLLHAYWCDKVCDAPRDAIIDIENEIWDDTSWGSK